jgi:hypothetical protein
VCSCRLHSPLSPVGLGKESLERLLEVDGLGVRREEAAAFEGLVGCV